MVVLWLFRQKVCIIDYVSLWIVYKILFSCLSFPDILSIFVAVPAHIVYVPEVSLNALALCYFRNSAMPNIL